MIFTLYCVKDRKADAFTFNIFVADNDACAKRAFYQMYKDAVDSAPNSPLASYPADFELYCIGIFDTSEAIVDTDKRFICSASSFLSEV